MLNCRAYCVTWRASLIVLLQENLNYAKLMLDSSVSFRTVLLTSNRALIHEPTITFFSNRSTYSNGQWYNLSLTISKNQTTLSVTHTGSNTQDSRTELLERGFTMPDGAQIVIGGTRVSFAGDIKNLRLSDRAASQNLMLRDLVGSEWMKDGGVSYEGIIEGDVRLYLNNILINIVILTQHMISQCTQRESRDTCSLTKSRCLCEGEKTEKSLLSSPNSTYMSFQTYHCMVDTQPT